MDSKEQARQEIAKLVAAYQGLDDKAINKYTEADTRRVFILPLFSALGWDVYSKEEVSEEERASKGRVDYAFRLRGVTRFYLEAKSLRVDLNRQEHAKQIITYAYGKGITWGVLTDFEGLKVFNAQTGQPCLNLTHQNYLSDFEELWLLSKESFENEALDAWAEKHGMLPARLRVEQRLFNQLKYWREELFTELHLHNRHLTFEQIDEVIQRLFNRLIFIRTCEDRKIEERVLIGSLRKREQTTGRKGELVEVLRQIFRDFDGYYDSDLFALHLADEVFIEAKTIEEIIKGLYDVPGAMASYDFDVIDADVLGAVYEQYLGHVATVAQRRVKEAQLQKNWGLPSEVSFELTAKKQRRKEQGIYYTPKFITNYIVKETVGRFLQERSYDQALKMKVLDMACGSGSFLIRAYDELLNYHADKRSKAVSELDQWERLPVLTGNIFGLDLDIQAVEIARLNLLLKSLARRERLPSLKDNVRQGNALISGADEELRTCFGEAWREKRPFDWEREFPQIMGEGGFDVIIGNPPYVRIQTLPKDEVSFYNSRYSAATGNYDIYVLFVERALQMLKPGGMMGFILPNKFFNTAYGVGVRKAITDTKALYKIVDFGDAQIFGEATTYTCLLFLQRQANEQFVYVQADEWFKAQKSMPQTIPDNLAAYAIKAASISDAEWNLLHGEGSGLLQRLSAMPVKLGDIAHKIAQGLVTSGDQVWRSRKKVEPVF